MPNTAKNAGEVVPSRAMIAPPTPAIVQPTTAQPANTRSDAPAGLGAGVDRPSILADPGADERDEPDHAEEEGEQHAEAEERLP